MKNRIYLSPPHLEGGEINEIIRIIESNWIAPIGPDLDKLEEEISSHLDINSACLTNSGTSALHLALILLGVAEDDYVIVQDLTHIGGVNPILYQKAIPVFVDSEKESWNMDPEILEKAILDCVEGKIVMKGKKLKPGLPKAIIPVHLYGMPANLAAIKKLSEKYSIPIIEDAAEALGSTYNGRCVGTFGNFGVISFNGNKIITTSGGGVLVSDDSSIIKRAKYFATQARDQAIHYQHSQVGYNYRMSNVLAGLGFAQMKVLSNRIGCRRSNYKIYWDYFRDWNHKGYDVVFQEEGEGSFSNRWLSAVLIDPKKNNGLTVKKIHSSLENENIESRPLWKPMHLQPVFNGYPFIGEGISEELFNNGLCLPSGSNLGAEDFERIFMILDNLFNK